MIIDSEYLTSLLKRGRHDEFRRYCEERDKRNEDETFNSYMDKLISECKYSRSKIAQRAGLSRDYVYKLLRGDKRTTERDYVIAIGLAMELSFFQMQKALNLYPFVSLDSDDIRSRIIMAAFTEHVDMDMLNNWLEKAGLPILRISPEMPSAEIGPIRSTSHALSMANSYSDEGHEPSKKRSFKAMNKSNTTVTAEHCGMAPMDFFFAAEFELNDEQGSTVYAQTCFWPDGSSFFAVDKVSMYEEKYVNESIVLERYDTLEEASDSEYFLYYLELDKLTDKKVIEVMNYIDDTRNFNSRIGARVEKHGVCPYIEVFNTTQPQYNEYLQIRTSENGYVYSASHKSYYMRLELGDMYNLYFTNNETPLFLFEITSLDDLGKYEYFRSSFEQMIKMMEGNMKDMNKQPEITEISRRIMFSNNEGLACGPFSINAIDAEIVVNDSGKTIYLHGQWVSEGDGDFLFEAAEKSIYDICERINRNEGDFDSNIEEINKIRDIGINDIFPECNIEVRYTSQHAILIEMIKDELRKREISSVLLEEDDDDEA